MIRFVLYGCEVGNITCPLGRVLALLPQFIFTI